jgi:hypothetical protein
VYLELTLYRLQHLVGAVEIILARVPYTVDHLLGGVVALGSGGNLLFVSQPVTPRVISVPRIWLRIEYEAETIPLLVGRTATEDAGLVMA